MQPNYAFTASVRAGKPQVLNSECEISLAGMDEERQTFQAIWDTGATHSAITQKVVDLCELKPTGQVEVSHAGIDDALEETDTYLVDLGLPNRVLMRNVEVSRGGFTGGDVLIGMDIINMGDFAITHPNGGSKFTFQIPPQADIDFVDAPMVAGPNREQRRARVKVQRRRQS